MKTNRLVLAGAAVALTLLPQTYGRADDRGKVGSEKIKHVLLLSIDGMHARGLLQLRSRNSGSER
jgi:hypothetical protein